MKDIKKQMEAFKELPDGPDKEQERDLYHMKQEAINVARGEE